MITTILGRRGPFALVLTTDENAKSSYTVVHTHHGKRKTLRRFSNSTEATAFLCNLRAPAGPLTRTRSLPRG